jgi:uncharacterized protein (DUF362 family)
MKQRRLTLVRVANGLKDAAYTALDQTGLLARVGKNARVALKPNFTYPYYKRGVTTSPAFIRAVVEILRDYTANLSLVETDGGYGVWTAAEAFAGHDVYALRDEFGLEIVNLCDEPSEPIGFVAAGRPRHVLLPTRLLYETDLMISLPVPKIHCMTGLSLSYKNQWGCVPDIMRLRRHYVFDEAIVAINRALAPAVLADGTYFLDDNGPMDGTPVCMNLVIAATDAGAFDRYVAELMGFSWNRIRHLRVAVECGDMPANLDGIVFNVSPIDARTRVFRLRRTLRNWIALTGFRSRTMTWLGYESWFGRTVLHSILYALAGKPVSAAPSEPDQSYE